MIILSSIILTDADYADVIPMLANTPNQAETLLHSLEQVAAGIGPHVNVPKTEYMCFNQAGDISTLEGTSLRLVVKFTYEAMNDREKWRERVRDIHASGTTWWRWWLSLIFLFFVAFIATYSGLWRIAHLHRNMQPVSIKWASFYIRGAYDKFPDFFRMGI